MNHAPAPSLIRSGLFGLLAVYSAARLPATPLYSESFESAATAKVLVNKQTNTEVAYVDYSALIREQAGNGGPVTLKIPEAPNRLPGSAATRGVLMDVTYTGTARTINLLASSSPGGAAATFAGNYRMAFDMWLAMDPAALFGTTEVGLFGIGISGTNTVSYARRATGVGTVGWASTEGGISTGVAAGLPPTNGDMGLYIDTLRSFVTENFYDAETKYKFAFPQGTPFVGNPVNQWTQVEVIVAGGKVAVFLNGLKFGETTTQPATSGFAAIGYEDPFTGATSFPSATNGGSPLTNRQFGLFDNFTIDTLPGPQVLEAAPVTTFTGIISPDSTSTGTFSVTNTSPATSYNITAATIDGPDAAGFALLDAFPLTIPPLEPVILAVQFNPGNPNGLKVARLNLTTTDPNLPVIRLPLQARRAVPSLLATVTTRIVSVAVEGGTGTGILTITNNGPASAILTNPLISGPDAAMFSLSATFPVEVPSLETVQLPVVFTPTGAAGLKTASLELTSTDPGVPTLTIALVSRYAFGPPLLAHYKMDDASGTSLVDATAVSPAAGLQIREIPFGFGQASLLPGGAGTAVRLTPADTSTSGNFAVSNVVHLPSVSYSMWIKPEFKGGKRTILHRSSLFSTAGTIYALYLTPAGRLVFEVNSATAVESADGAILDDTVYHIAVTHSDPDAFGNVTASRTRLFINGVMVAESVPELPETARGFTDYNLNTTSAGLYIGTTTSAGGTGYVGILDDLQIYSVELAKGDVAGMFSQAGKTAYQLEVQPYRITSVQYDPETGGLNLTWNSAPGAVYSVQQSDGTGPFTDVPDFTGIPSDGVITSVTVTGIEGSRRFFQIRRTSPP